jgi:6,7-dimethyl-8-ribityllumazine synthase
MQQEFSINPPIIPGARIAVLQSKWYREHTDRMLEKCRQVLQKAQCTNIAQHVVPGSLELPLAAKLLARSTARPDAIICFGAILKGDTYHFDIVLKGCSEGLARVSLDEQIPIINEVLPVTSIDQLHKRSADDQYNKGIEAGLAAAEIVAWIRSLEA